MKYALTVLWMGIALNLNAQFIINNGIELNNSALLVTNGDWTNDAGTHITHRGTINTSESFINNGTLDPAGLGNFILRYDTDLTFLPGGSHMANLTKNGKGTLMLEGTIAVKDTLLINGGLVSLKHATDTVALMAGATLLVADNSWIEGGFVSRAGTGDVIFPLGKDGLYLPLKIYRINAEEVTAAVTDAPPSHTAGPGVDALIDFPYAWKVQKKNEADTSAYVEINYPNSLPVVANPIVVREIESQQYASMGARLIQDSGDRTTVKSYSRRLNGLFTVAQGFPSDPETDSLALVALYASTGGASWQNAAGWLSGTIDTWFGVTVNGQSITAVELPANNLNGPVADQLVDILSLQTVNLAGNRITALPDFSLNAEISALNVSDNHLNFASLEPNASVPGLSYLIQAELGTPLDTAIQVGNSYALHVPAGGASSQFQWKHNGLAIPDGTDATYTLPAISRETMGTYVAEVTNPTLPGLTLKSSAQKVLAWATLSGNLRIGTDLPAEKGELTLYRVKPGAFEPVETVAIENNGHYTFNNVILDDYQVRGFADTLVHERALPTYYESTIFWEEADTLQLTDHTNNLDIISQLEPAPPSGRGSISGYLQEDDGTGRLAGIERNKRVEGAGVSVRRVERTGRTKGETLILVAYVFTNANGEFNLPNLPVGEYRLNFQYPGYPMDETTYTTIHIGTALESQVMVEANVLGGKIQVRKLVITSLYEAEHYHAEVFPNPAVEHIRLKFAGEVRGRFVSVTDMQGKALHTYAAEKKEALIDVAYLQKGLYILRIIEQGRSVKTMKVSIE